MTPFEGALYFTEEGEAKRQAVNAWTRTSGAYDGVIDFDAVVRDSNNPRRFLPMYHLGDWLHPNDKGFRTMGEAIALTLFASPREESADITLSVTVSAVAGPG